MNLRQIFLMILILISPFHASCMMESPSEFTPQNSKFAIDLHGVIVSEPMSFFYGIQKIANWDLVSDLKKFYCWDLIPACNRLVPWFILESMAFIVHGIMYGFNAEDYAGICTEYEQEQFLASGMRIANSVV